MRGIIALGLFLALSQPAAEAATVSYTGGRLDLPRAVDSPLLRATVVDGKVTGGLTMGIRCGRNAFFLDAAGRGTVLLDLLGRATPIRGHASELAPSSGN